MRNALFATFAFAAGAFLSALPANADENLFGYTYGAETLPKGHWEVYTWNTARVGKGKGTYLGLDFQQEIEYGVTDRLQVSFYLNEAYHYISGGALEEDGNRISENEFGFNGINLAFKYMVLSPFKDPIGLALYVEPEWMLLHKISGAPIHELALEYKIILQKNFLNDQLIWALNLNGETAAEIARTGSDREWEYEQIFEVTSGLTYRIAPGWYFGPEIRYHTEFPDINKMLEQEHWAVFLGASLHYGAEKWWATLTVLPQLAGWPTEWDRSSQVHLEEHENIEIRLKVGWNF